MPKINEPISRDEPMKVYVDRPEVYEGPQVSHFSASPEPFVQESYAKVIPTSYSEPGHSSAVDLSRLAPDEARVVPKGSEPTKGSHMITHLGIDHEVSTPTEREFMLALARAEAPSNELVKTYFGLLVARTKVR